MSTETRFASVLQVAKILGVSKSSVYTLLDAGEIKSHVFGGNRRVPVPEIEEYISRTAFKPKTTKQE